MNKEFDLDYYYKEIYPILDIYTHDFVLSEYGRGLELYKLRINQIGLDKCGQILDAGGAIANWSIPLALTNNCVSVVDINPLRLFIGKQMSNKMDIPNIKFYKMSIDNLNFPDASFDAVVCYSVIMFSDVSKTLAEFHRVLKPNGKLFIQADLWRWHFYGDFPDKRNAIIYLIKLFINKFIFRRINIFTRKSFVRYLENSGFHIYDIGQDGQTTFNVVNLKHSKFGFYPIKKSGFEQLIEVCAVKKEAQ